MANELVNVYSDETRSDLLFSAHLSRVVTILGMRTEAQMRVFNELFGANALPFAKVHGNGRHFLGEFSSVVIARSETK